MVRMKIPAEIQDYKSKLIFGLSVRQFFSIAAAMLVGVPIGVCGHGHISGDILPWIVILTVMPFFCFGFCTVKGLRFEMFLLAIYRYLFRPRIRVYEDADDELQKLQESIIEQYVLAEYNGG